MRASSKSGALAMRCGIHRSHVTGVCFDAPGGLLPVQPGGQRPQVTKPADS